MRGRRPELRTIEGGKGKPAAPKLIPAPAHLPKSCRSTWAKLAADLTARGLWHDAMATVLASYCIATWQVAECIRALQQDGAFVRTKGGEPKPHPAHGLLNKANELVARLGAELGITPAARSRKGLQGIPEVPNDGAPADLDL